MNNENEKRTPSASDLQDLIHNVGIQAVIEALSDYCNENANEAGACGNFIGASAWAHTAGRLALVADTDAVKALPFGG